MRDGEIATYLEMHKYVSGLLDGEGIVEGDGLRCRFHAEVTSDRGILGPVLLF